MAKQKSPSKKPVTKPDDEDQEGKEGEEDTDDSEDSEDDAEAENRRINAIVTSRVKREMKPLLGMLTQIQETLKTQTAKKSEETSEDDSDDSGEETTDSKKPVVDTKVSRKMARIEAQLAEERQARKKAETERAEEQEKAKNTEMRTIFGSALAEHGVTDPILQRAALREIEAQGYMVRDDDGKIKFKGQDKYGIETLFDPKAGLKAWVAGEGKSFVPAVDAGGSGTGGSRGTGNGTESLTSRQISKLSEQQKASINLERACSGLPPLGE